MKSNFCRSGYLRQASKRIADEELFRLRFRALKGARLSDLLSVSSRFTTAEAYNDSGAFLSVKLVFEPETEFTSGLELYQNVPNPFSSSTSIHYILKESGKVQLHIIDINGKIVEILIDEVQTAGEHQHIWNADKVEDGIYFYKLVVNGQSMARRMILLR